MTTLNMAKQIEVLNLPHSSFKKDEVSGIRKYIEIKDVLNHSMYIPLRTDMTREELENFVTVFLSSIEYKTGSICAKL